MFRQIPKLKAAFQRNDSGAWCIVTPINSTHFSLDPSRMWKTAQTLSLNELQNAEAILTKILNKQKTNDIVPAYQALLNELRIVIKEREKGE